MSNDKYGCWEQDLASAYGLHLETVTPEVLSTLDRDLRMLLPAPPQSVATGIHLHVHYADLWPEMRLLAERLPPDARKIVSTSDESLAARIENDHPDFDVRVMENRGRDILPFLRLLDEGVFNGLDAVCKIHSKKKSAYPNKNAFLGHAWRSRVFHDLLGTSDRIMEILETFANNPCVGMIGPAWARLPNERFPRSTALKIARAPIEALLAPRFGSGIYEKIEFFAGSMFWFRPSALDGLTDLTRSLNFSPEPVAETASSWAHNCERVFLSYAALSGYEIRSV